MKQTIILVILDGWGVGKANETNPIYIANPPVINYIQNNFPSGALQASGIAVGLPWEEEGNSEVGHLTIGAGKVLYQHFPRILLAIKDGSFFENEMFKKAFVHSRENKSAVHLIGLLADGNVHASLRHLTALIAMAKEQYCEKLYLHLWSDGRDSPPKSFLTILERLKKEIIDARQPSDISREPVIASVAGRYYAMDRNEHWDRTNKAYNVLTGNSPTASSVESAISEDYSKKLDDEFIEPNVIGEPHPINSGDSLIFFNFREDSMRQITAPFLDKNFDKFPIKKIDNVFIVTMTEYDKKFPINVAFPNEVVAHPLGKILADNKKTQLRIAETNKYAHVTYFFNGLKEESYEGESRILVPTQNVVRQDIHPEMMARAITDRAILAINENRFDFILINYANADIIAHTGNYPAVIEAIKVLNTELERLLTVAYPQKHTIVITADHGNAEVLLDPKTGNPETKHNISPVPFYLIDYRFKKEPGAVSRESSGIALPIFGILSDVAPTILDLMKLPKPPEMTGQSLLEQLI